jgi:hypothetical protein
MTRNHLDLLLFVAADSASPVCYVAAVSVLHKLQIKPEMKFVLLRKPESVSLDGTHTSAIEADAVLVFIERSEDLQAPEVRDFVEAALRDAVAWIAYPKAGQLGTDVNRDSLARLVSEFGVRPVRQVSIDSTWSALRFRPGSFQPS